ncbi:hypothetical protein AURDEDRAFT_163536 [Auricularia subglabra TFB-10046 SS5]|nr:hypothetical protein AURDEDRAFT_163536 [Auricularia subglabra TFB-10046 SS5]
MSSAASLDNSVLVLPLLDWDWYMDAETARVRAFAAGVADGQTLNFGARMWCPRGSENEILYLRGYAVGVGDWQDDNPQASDPIGGRGYRNPLAAREYDYFLRGVAAILPLPVQPEPRPALHAGLEAVGFTATALLHVPLPNGVDRDVLAASWPPLRRAEIFDTHEPGYWVIPECRLTAPVATALLAEVLLMLSSPVMCWSGTVFARGTHAQIRELITGRVWATSHMCFFVFPNHPVTATFVCSFVSAVYGRADHKKVYGSVVDALEASAAATALCSDHGYQADDAYHSLSLEYVLLVVVTDQAIATAAGDTL